MMDAVINARAVPINTNALSISVLISQELVSVNYEVYINDLYLCCISSTTSQVVVQAALWYSGNC